MNVIHGLQQPLEMIEGRFILGAELKCVLASQNAIVCICTGWKC